MGRPRQSEDAMKGTVPTEAGKLPRTLGSLFPPKWHRNAFFENESWLGVNRFITVISGTLLIRCPEYI
jgi:hypothetical protein